MAYTTDLKSVARKGLRVQVPPLAPINTKKIDNNVNLIYNRDIQQELGNVAEWSMAPDY
jgi:hypothetical protein